MTEKEWKIIDEEFISYTGGTAQLISNGECKVHLWETPKDAQLFCDKLNEQHEQIEDLKDANVRCCNEYSYFHKRMMELEEENEQLKSICQDHRDHAIDFKADCIRLEKENEQLKQQLKELQEFKDNYDKNMELIHNNEYVQDFLNGNL